MLKMQIEKIIYETTRFLPGIEDKLRIATVFIFCYKLSSEAFAKLLYTNNHEKFIESLNSDYEMYGVDFSIRLSDRNVNECFRKTLQKVKDKYDQNGYHKALYEGDEFALVIAEIVKYDFSSIEIRKITTEIKKQLNLFDAA